MPYITREDGQHFVIPSYRDVLAIKQPAQLKKEIFLLSQSYGEYITLQKKGAGKYEVAFSPDTGYLLGETVWHYFKRPLDMIYCEAIPNTTEAILVIVKAGSVYLDGSFPLDSIPEELVIFLTQQNNFEIHTYGDVPITQTPETGKFSFDAASVKSFTVSDKPIFPALPLLRMYQLQLVDPVLKMQGIGVFPARQLILGILMIGVGWMLWSYFKQEKVEPAPKAVANPYQLYINTLNTPAPEDEINHVIETFRSVSNIPGWIVNKIDYNKGTLKFGMQSIGGTASDVINWANQNGMISTITPGGIFLSTTLNLPKRALVNKIHPLNEVIAVFVDRLASVYPGNRLSMGTFVKKGQFSSAPFTIRLDRITTVLLELIGKQCVDLPFILQNITASVDASNNLTGIISIEALGD